jgi:Tfp pilus assembly protein PilF
MTFETGCDCRFARSMTALVLVVCAMLTVRTAAAQGTPAGTLLVMPFDNEQRDGRLFWLQEASAVLVADNVNAYGGSAITRNERVRAFERLHLPVVATLSHATVIRVGQLVGATEVIVGRLELSGDELTVRARKITLDSGRMQPEMVERARLHDLFPLFERVSRALVPGLSSTSTRSPQPPLQAFEQFIKGLLAESPAMQLKFLEGALKIHPRYDRAQLAIWDVQNGQGEHAKALLAATAVAESSPIARRAGHSAALSLIALKRYDEAFVTLKRLQDAEGSSVLLNNLGVVQLRRGATPETGRATYYFNAALDRDPADPDLHFNLGYAYWLERDAAAAAYWLREAVRRNPADGDAHFVLGAALQATGTNVEAVREIELARQLSSTYDEWQRRATGTDQVPRGLERLKGDLTTPREQEIDIALSISAQRPQREMAAFHLDRARRLFDDQRDYDAMTELRRSIFLSPYQAEAHLMLGRIYQRTGRASDAIDSFKIAVWSGETAEARVALGEAYLQAGDKAAARVEADRALVLDPTSTAAQALLGKIASLQ